MNFNNSRLVDHKPMKFGTFVPYMYRFVIIVKYLTNFFKLEWNLGIKFTLHFFFHSVYIKNFKNLLVRNQWTDFNITWKECVFGHPLPRLFKPSWFVKKYGCKGVGLIFPIYLYRKLEKKSSCQKPLDRFQFNLAEMFPWWPFTKIVQAVMICQKTWLLGGGAYFPCISI